MGQLCIPPGMYGFVGGYCSASCSMTNPCPSDASCVDVGAGVGSFCFKTCAKMSDCRMGYQCQGVCFPANSTGSGMDVMPGTNNGAACDMPIVNAPGTGALFGADQALSSGGQINAEVEVAADPAHQRVVVAWIAEANNHAKIGVRISDDGGVSFGSAFDLPATGDPADTNSDQSDPVVAVDPQGNFYISWVGFDRSGGNPNPTNMNIYVARIAAGATTATLTNVAPGESNAAFLDKPWIAASPLDGTLYVTWNRTTNNNAPEMRVARSTNGTTWAAPMTFSDNLTAADRNLAQIVVGADGKAYATWVEIAADQFGSTANKIMLQRFNADGTRNGSNVTVSAGADSPSFDDPSVAVFGSNVYVGFVSGTSTGAWDVRTAASLDGGATFKPSVKVNDDATCATHFHHQTAVDAAGHLHVVYYDNRYLNGNVFHQSSPAATAATPLAFGAPTFVNSQTFPFTTSRSTQGWLGDYLGFWIAGGEMYAAWTDPRNGGQSQIYFARGAVP